MLLVNITTINITTVFNVFARNRIKLLSKKMEFTGIRQPSDDPPQCSATMDNFYSHVLNDVIDKSSEHFLEEGVDLETINELKTIWTLKLQQNIKVAKANASKLHVTKMLLATPQSCDSCIQKQEFKRENAFVKCEPEFVDVKHIKEEMCPEFQGVFIPVEAQPQPVDSWLKQEVAYTFPLQVKINNSNPPFAVTVHVTQDQINGNRIKALFTRDVLNDLRHLSTVEATERMQALVDQEYKDHMSFNMSFGQYNMEFTSIGSLNDVGNFSGQVDGTDDEMKIKVEKSDSDTDIDEDDMDTDDDDDDLAAILNEGDDDSEPDPDSGDDITEEEVEDTDNLILCQYTHVKRQKNHWKFRFENGIMIIDGVEFVFQRATGEGIW